MIPREPSVSTQIYGGWVEVPLPVADDLKAKGLDHPLAKAVLEFNHRVCRDLGMHVTSIRIER